MLAIVRSIGTKEAQRASAASEPAAPQGLSPGRRKAGVAVSTLPMPSFDVIDPPTPDWPRLDDAARHGLAGDFVRLIEPQTEADVPALLLQLLCAVGNALGRSPHFTVEATRHRVNLFALLVGQTAKARKGTSLGHVKAVMREADEWWTTERIKGGLSSGEGLIWEVRDPIYKKEPLKEKGRVLGYEDVMTDPGVDNKKLLVMESEFSQVLRMMKREGNVLSVTLRQAWDGDDLRILTKNSPATASGAHISNIGHITQEELQRELDQIDASNGFLNRYLVACVRRSKLLPEGGQVDAEALRAIGRRLAHVLEVGQVVEEMHRTEACRARWREVYPRLTESRAGLTGAVVSRAEAHVTRLSCLYALLDESPTVHVDHLDAALAVWSYCEQSARLLFGDATGDPVADQIRRALRQAGPSGLVRSELHGLLGRNITAERLAKALTLLARLGLATCRQEESGGRPRERWLPGS